MQGSDSDYWRRRMDYWRNWTPGREIIEEHPKAEPTEPPKLGSVSFVGSHSGPLPIILSASGMAVHDSRAWAEDFHRWAISRCIFKDRCFGGISSLLRDFYEWQVMRDEVPCTRRTFEALLRDAGLLFADGLVYGVLLKGDSLAASESREMDGGRVGQLSGTEAARDRMLVKFLCARNGCF